MGDTQVHGMTTDAGLGVPWAGVGLTMKRRAYEILEVAREGDVTSRRIDRFILALIAANAIVVVLESMQAVNDVAGTALHRFDLFSVMVFSAEYVIRVWCCTVDPRYASPIRGRLRFMISPMGLIDLAAVLPFYLPAAGIDLRIARSVRLIRLLRLAKLVRYSSAFGVFGRIMRRRKEELVASLTCASFMLLVASSLMYIVEGHVQPDRFSSIPAAMWWGVSTMTTVGYGDVYPITPIGKLIGAVVSLIGMALFALPAGILGSGFIEDIQQRRSTKPDECPHCGGRVQSAAS